MKENKDRILALFMGLTYHQNVQVQDYQFFSSDPEGGGRGYARPINAYSKHPVLAYRTCDGDYESKVVDEDKTPLIKILKYQKSWGWLMSVVVRIESMGYETSMKYRRSKDHFFHELVITHNNNVVAETLSKIEWIETAEKHSKKEAVYEAVCNFVEDYIGKRHTL